MRALDNVSFAVDKGETIALVGESGSGKSVTAYAVMGILDPAGKVTAGRAMLGGLDLLSAKPSQLADVRGREIAMIFQNPRTALNPIRTVGRQIADVLIRHGNVPRRDAPGQAIDMLRAVGITDPARRAKAYPFEMSGGMCQRVMIAIALAAKPSLLIADEPTTGLDVTTQAVIMDLVNDLAKEMGMATIFITHDSGAGRPTLGAHRRHACRPCGRERADRRAVQAPAASLYGGTDRGDAGCGGKPRRACLHSRLAPRSAPHRPAAVPLFRTLPAQDRCLRTAVAAFDFGVRPYGRLLESIARAHRGRANRERSMTILLDVADVSKLFPVGGGPGPLARFKRRFSGGPEKLPKVYAVDDVSFTINKGETVGLVGESGCGKSTLVRALTRLVDVSDGSIKLGTRELSLKPSRVFARDRDRARIQMVFQDAGESVNPRFTAFDAIADPLRRLRKMRGKALTERVETVASQCGLPLPFLSRYPHQLSGGQRARVGIARAIAVEPELLVLDEPTAALDVSVQVVILQLLQRLKKEFGMSYLFVSHDLSVVRLLCDRVLVMYLGKIVESGPAAEVFEHPLHPYTQALVAAVPRLHENGAGRLRLTGEPRSPIDPDPNVCRFYGRCPLSAAMCKTTMPKLRRFGPRQVACHFAEEFLLVPKA